MFEPGQFIEEKIKEISTIKGKGIVAISGGVDSTTCAVLAHRALGDRLEAVFIDDGLMRARDSKLVTKVCGDIGIKLRCVDVSSEFFEGLKGVGDPEEKRKKFRGTFYNVLRRVVAESGATHLVQGTIAADILETKKGIKTQHNVLEQIGIDTGLRLIEPLKEIYKPQVREVARALGLPSEVCERMPFPGPGLATRIVGEVTPQRVQVVKKATEVVEEEIISLKPKPFQAFAVLLKDKATGVREGKRQWGDIVVVRSVESEDALTAGVTKIPWAMLERIQKRITDEIPSVTKVLFDLTPKPPSTIEYI